MESKGFSILNQQKYLNLLFPRYLNTYVMGLRPLYIQFISFSVGTIFIRLNLTFTDVIFWCIEKVPALKGLDDTPQPRDLGHV